MEKYKNRDWLYGAYVISKMNCTEIAKECNRDPKTIWSWLKKFEIPTRKRGADSSPGTFKKGHKYGVGRIHTEETKEKLRQARYKDGRVPYLKDGKHWLKHEGSVSPMWKGGVTPERQKVYSSIEWSEAVKKVWSRDNATCQRCGKYHNTCENRGTFHIHHIVSFMVEDKRTDYNNLILLCKDCHLWVHSKKNKTKKFLENE